MINRILVVLGGSQYMDSVVQTAITLAQRYGATLAGRAIVDASLVDSGEAVPVGGGGADKEAREQRIGLARTGALEAMHRFEELCQKAQVEHTTETLEGDCIEVLRDEWRFQDVGLIGIREIFDYGAVSNERDVVVKLINSGVSPLIAVNTNGTKMERVLVAFNGSFESCKALKQWLIVHGNKQVQVRVLTCGDECSEADLQRASDYVRAHGIESVECVRVDGSPTDKILPESESWGADLIIAGSTGRNWLSRMVIGDTARHLVENSQIALFLLH